MIGGYDGLAIRSSTTVTQEILDAATNLKVIGRAGIGVDNVDIPAATARGVVVMNTPFGNSVTTAEHAISMMMALARQIPQANESTHAGKWEKSKFMGVELFNKTLGVIGCGNIGSIAASRGLGLKMKVIGFDPFLTEERATELGIEKVELDELYARADFITLHVPKTDKTANMINAEAISKMKDGVRIINCARGGLVVEDDLKVALDSGKVAGAALDVFEVEPAKENQLFGHPNVICTPHLGASTTEAQVNVALQVAEQMADYLLSGAVTNALNMPSISAEDAPKLKPYMELAGQLGSFSGQLTEHAIKSINIIYDGSVAVINSKPLTSIIVASVLKELTESVNMVNAMDVAKSRGISISETRNETSNYWRSAITVTLETEERTRSVTGSLFTGKAPRVVRVEDVYIEAALQGNMLFMRNDDLPGMIGSVGKILGDAGVNIADFRLGRKPEEKTALSLVSIDDELSSDVMDQLGALPQIKQIKKLKFG